MSEEIFLIVFYIISCFSQFILFYIFGIYTKKKLVKSKKILFIILITSLFETIISIWLNKILNAIICVIYFIVMVKKIFCLKFKDTVFYMAVVWLIGMLLDILLMLIVNLILSKLSFIKVNIDIARLICTPILIILLVLIARLKITKKIVDKAYTYFYKFNYIYIYWAVILTLFFILECITFINIRNKVVVELILFSTVLTCLIAIKFISYQYDLITLKETNNLLIKNNEFYIKIIDDYRVLKHNLTSQLLGIKSVSNKKAKILIDDLIKDYNANFRSTHYIKNTPKGLNGIIYEKFYNFNNDDLKLLINNKIINNILDVITPRSYNLLCEALGVLLDNAMEAAIKSKDKVIFLDFKENEDIIEIAIVNTFLGDIDLEKLGTVNYTSKSDHWGIGLYSLLSKKNIQIKTSIRNNIFESKIIVKKKNIN